MLELTLISLYFAEGINYIPDVHCVLHSVQSSYRAKAAINTMNKKINTMTTTSLQVNTVTFQFNSDYLESLNIHHTSADITYLTDC